MFAITAATNHILLNDKREGEVSITVTNQLSRPVRGRAVIVPLTGAVANWFGLIGEAERDFAPAGTQQYTVYIRPSVAAPAGAALFRLDVIGVANPDEEFSEGPTITFETPAPLPAKKSFPWWLIVAAVALLGLCGLGLVAVLTNKDKDDNGPVAMSVEIMTGANGTADNLVLLLNGSFVGAPFQITLDNPNDLQPFQSDTYRFDVPAGLCQISSFQLVKVSRFLILQRWDLQAITISVDGEELFTDQPAVTLLTNQRFEADLTKSEAFQARCGN